MMWEWKSVARQAVLGAKRQFCAALELLVADRQEARFRRRLKKRVGEQRFDCKVDELSARFATCYNALRHVLEEQFDLPNVLLSDDLVKNAPDVPIDQIVQDALELLGSNAVPRCESWNGTFGDLVRILEEAIANDRRESH